MASKKADSSAAPASASSAADKAVAGYDGWQILHQADAQVAAAKAPDGGTVQTVSPAVYVAGKRVGLGIVEFTSSSLDDLKAKIEGWEQAQPASEPASASEEQILNSAKATLHQSVTSGARPAVDVDLTPAQDKVKPKATNLSVDVAISENKLSDADQAGISAMGPDSKLDGVGAPA